MEEALRKWRGTNVRKSVGPGLELRTGRNFSLTENLYFWDTRISFLVASCSKWLEENICLAYGNYEHETAFALSVQSAVLRCGTSSCHIPGVVESVWDTDVLCNILLRYLFGARNNACTVGFFPPWPATLPREFCLTPRNVEVRRDANRDTPRSSTQSGCCKLAW